MKTILLFFFFTFSTFIAAQQKVYIAYIEGDIDLGLAPYVSRVVANAEEDEAAAIIFKINTFGGRVDAATQIKDAIIGTDLLTIALINKRYSSDSSILSFHLYILVIEKNCTQAARFDSSNFIAILLTSSSELYVV